MSTSVSLTWPEKIGRLMEHRSLTLTEFCQALNTRALPAPHLSSVSRWYRGLTVPAVMWQRRIDDLLVRWEVPVDNPGT